MTVWRLCSISESWDSQGGSCYMIGGQKNQGQRRTGESPVPTQGLFATRIGRVEGAREGNYFPGIREEENWPCEKALGISYLEFSRER